MTHSETIKEIATALAKVQGEVESAIKDKENHVRGKYADLTSVWTACRAALSHHGIAVVQSPTYTNKQAGVVTMMMHSSGEWFRNELVLPVVKDDAQGAGSAITYARRYSLAAMVGVVADEDDDGAHASGITGSKEAAKAVGERKLHEMKAAPEPAPSQDPYALVTTATLRTMHEEFVNADKFRRRNLLKALAAKIGGDPPYREILKTFGGALKSTELEDSSDHVKFYDALLEVYQGYAAVQSVIHALHPQTATDIIKEMVGESKTWMCDKETARSLYKALASAKRAQDNAKEDEHGGK